MNKKVFASLGLLGALAFAAPANAHFMMVNSDANYLPKAEALDMRIAFTHPAEAGHMMNMGGINEFYTLTKKGDNAPVKTDMKKYLKEITWTNPESSAPAYAVSIPRKELRSMGDYMFVMTPGYYLEKEEDCYMQQITKFIVNVGGVPTLWNEPADLPCEIVPMGKPYAQWVGNVFQGVVMSKGKPVANAEIEVEYMAHQPNFKTNSMPAKSSLDYQDNAALVTQTIIADANGVFSYALPKAGWWGFAALGVGPDKEYKGKELSQDAVIWVKATEVK